MNKLLLFLFLSPFIFCKGQQTFDGLYCAEVQYFNQRTGTTSSYTLTVEVKNNELIKINFPQGWLDDEHYTSTFESDGHAEFTSDRGYEYEVQIIEEGDDCLNYVPKAVQCRGITKGGKQCKRLTDNHNGLCWQHQNQ